jgi:hypothetical protein
MQYENMQPNKNNPENKILLLAEIIRRCTMYYAQVEGAFQSLIPKYAHSINWFFMLLVMPLMFKILNFIGQFMFAE